MKSRFYIPVVLIITILLCSVKITSAQRYPFYNLSVESGLIQSQAMSLAQDKFGHLWIGTLGGLSRYDGKNFINYSVRDGMVDNTVNALATAKDGTIWVGGVKGISQYDGKRFKNFVFDTENVGANSVTEIHIATDGTVWCIAGNKIYSINSGKTKLLPLPSTGKNISALLPDNKQIWIAATDGTIYKHDGKKWDSLTFNDPILNSAPFVYRIYKDSKQNIYITTSVGLFKFTNNQLTAIKPGNYALPPVGTITEDKNGALWMGTGKGAIRLKDSTVTYYNKKNGLTDNPIYSIITDTEGNIWFASDGQGIYRFSGAQFTMLDETMGLPSAQIMSIAAAHGRLYLGTYDAGLYTYEGGQTYKVPLPISPVPAITAIEIRNGYDIWLGTRGNGILKYNGGLSFTAYKYPTILSNMITCMYGESGRQWIGFVNGAMIYERDSFRKVDFKPTTVFDFMSIGADSVLIATSEGIKLYNNNSVSSFITNTAVDSASSQCFAVKGNEIWVGTSDNGVICYNTTNKTSVVINKNNGLQSDFIYNIIADNDGNIWIGTGYGIHKIRMTKGKPVITFYGKEQGMVGMESNHNAVFKMPDGSIWFGTINGAVHYNPAAKLVYPKASSIVLQSVKVFGENISDTTYYDSTEVWYKVPYGLKLPYRKNNITFTFQAVSLSGVEQIKYRYRIDGLDAPWSDWSSTNTITYSAMPPGKYILRVECLAGSNEEVNTMEYHFEIITPFHKTGWFKIVIIIGCILLGITLQYITNRRKQNRLALMERLRREEQNKVRERTAEDFHDEVGNKLTRINVLADVLKEKIGPLSPDNRRILDQIKDNTAQLYGGTRDILWSLKPSNDNLYEILHRIRDFGGELFQDTDIDFSFTGTEEKWRHYKLPLDVSRNLIMIFKEALNNTLKYARAKHVKLEVHVKEHNVLQLVLSDDGQGFDTANYKKGHGINNMNVRAKRIHGKLYMDSTQGKGTIINLNFKLPLQDH